MAPMPCPTPQTPRVPSCTLGLGVAPRTSRHLSNTRPSFPRNGHSCQMSPTAVPGSVVGGRWHRAASRFDSQWSRPAASSSLDTGPSEETRWTPGTCGGDDRPHLPSRAHGCRWWRRGRLRGAVARPAAPAAALLQADRSGAAEDLAAETWVAVIRGIGRFQGDEAAFRAWVFTIARHKARDWWRRAARTPVQALPATSLAEPSAPDDPAATVLEAASTRAALALIATLPAGQAEAVVLRVVAGLEVKQVAELMDKRPNTVRVLTHRGLRRLAAAPRSTPQPRSRRSPRRCSALICQASASRALPARRCRWPRPASMTCASTTTRSCGRCCATGTCSPSKAWIRRPSRPGTGSPPTWAGPTGWRAGSRPNEPPPPRPTNVERPAEEHEAPNSARPTGLRNRRYHSHSIRRHSPDRSTLAGRPTRPEQQESQLHARHRRLWADF